MKRRGFLANFALVLVIIIMLGIIAGAVYMGIKTEWYTDFTIFTGAAEKPSDDKENPKEDETQDGTVQDGEGATLTSGEVYELPAALLYSARTAESSDAGEGIKVKATVSPSTAITTAVTWKTAFANAQSEWATGKTVSNYFTAAAVDDEEQPNTVLLTCIKPFGEPIMLTATSVQDPTKSVSCRVDFRQRLADYTLSFGDVECDFENGETGVEVELGRNFNGAGGALNAQLTYQPYTVADNYTVTYSLSSKYLLLKDRLRDSTQFFSFGLASYVFDGEGEGSELGGMGSGDSYYNCENSDRYDYSDLEEYDLETEGLFFSFNHFAKKMGLKKYDLIAKGYGDNHYCETWNFSIWETFSASRVASAYENIVVNGGSSMVTGGDIHKSSGLKLFDLQVRIASANFETVKKTTFVMAGYIDSTPIEVTLDPDQVVL